ncbi:phage head morphogenesis protein [Pusillimonas caeni]|uniref:phage head morphogenesis protein n=1 Tax=Pusillimonas caeni TaxID=1348472 RepID=UPI000E59AD59|nr:phage minor head protein [Pusillimonas caeni]TFL14209.1 phage head morphogenesis protein [Pusillimonas caeni]
MAQTTQRSTRPPRKPRKWLRPASIEREYVRYLRDIARDVNGAIEAKIIPVLSQLRQDDWRDIPESTGWYERLRLAVADAAALVTLPALVETVSRFGRRVDDFNAAQFHAILRAAYRVDIFQAEPWLAEVLSQFEAENIRLIRSIPQQALDRLHGKIVQAVRNGTPTALLRDTVREEYGITLRRAELIARDQIGKLNGQLTGQRQQGIGVTSYRWRGSLDERERDEHVAREGREIAWDDPPNDGHPGEPIQCRCWAEPILPLLEDIEGLVYTDPMPARGFTRTRLGIPP